MHPDPLERGRRWLELWEELKDVFGRDIDLLVTSTVKKPFFAQAIEKAHVELYAACTLLAASCPPLPKFWSHSCITPPKIGLWISGSASSSSTTTRTICR
jgi:hypothetical protein